MTEEVEYVDIDENHTWKDEAQRLYEQLEFAQGEIIANQLMTGLILQRVGPVSVTREEIANGLPGRRLSISEDETGALVTFELVES